MIWTAFIGQNSKDNRGTIEWIGCCTHNLGIDDRETFAYLFVRHFHDDGRLHILSTCSIKTGFHHLVNQFLCRHTVFIGAYAAACHQSF